jgi:hypothetical protein
MEIFTGVEILCPYPALYLEDIKAVVIADLHLGYEGIMAEQGIFMPKTQFRKEQEMLESIAGLKQAERVIINGDVKHEFSETSYHEFREVGELFEILRRHFEEVHVVKGNHDNFIIYVTRKHGIALHEELTLGKFHFFHGHRIPREAEAEFLVMGHEHPAIALYDEIGVKEKVKCFLYGEAGGKKLVVLPAFSPLAYGSDVNQVPKSELLSPLLRSIDVDKLNVVAVSEEAGCLPFAQLGELRRFA